MKRLISPTWLVAMTALPFLSAFALSQPADAATAEKARHQEQISHAEYDAMVAAQAQANGVPEVLVHRVILRESRYQPRLVSRGCIGLMQIKLATARSLGYGGDAEGLRDANTNLIYGVKYLAGAYRAANGDHNRAVGYYTTGYYEVAKRQRLDRAKSPEKLHPEKSSEPVLASAPAKDAPKEADAAKASKNPAGADAAQQVPPK